MTVRFADPKRPRPGDSRYLLLFLQNPTKGDFLAFDSIVYFGGSGANLWLGM